MNTRDNIISPESHERVQNLTGKAFTAFSYVTAITLGALRGAQEIRDLSYKHFAAMGSFDDLQDIRDEQIKKSLAEAKAKQASAPAAGSRDKPGLLERWKLTPPSQTSRDTKAIRQAYREEVGKWYAANDMHGIRDYFEPLQKNDRIKVATEAFTVAGIALGVLLTIANSKGLSKLLTKEDDGQSHSR